MFIEDHDYHVMDNTNENVTDNFFTSVGFHRDNELVVNNATTVTSLRFTDVSSRTGENGNLSGIQTTFQLVNGTTALDTITFSEYAFSTANISNGFGVDSLPQDFNYTFVNGTSCFVSTVLDQNQPYSTVARIVLAITACVICFVSLAANLLILVTVTFTKRLRTANTTFLINLSMSDLLTGAIVLPMVLTSVISSDPANMFAQVKYEYYRYYRFFEMF